jgi:hypothetical protein
MSWHVGFVAVSALLGERADDILAAMGGDAAPAGVARWAHSLNVSTREERAREIARAVAPLAAEIEKGRLL